MTLLETDADRQVARCLVDGRNFAMIAGAGSGKTTSLITALHLIRRESGARLRQNGQRVACVTFTKRAVEVIRSRLGFDELYEVSTLHSFLWGAIGRFHSDVREALVTDRIPRLIVKAQERDSGKETKEARRARAQIEHLERSLESLSHVTVFRYEDAAFSDYENGSLSHDDIIEVAGWLLAGKANLRRIFGFRYPYIFVDEAQDTFQTIVTGFNLTCAQPGLPLVGYFGDPWQQIYEDRAGAFAPPEGGLTITKTENFRCSKSVISLLNAFRQDVEQVPAGKNRDLDGSVEIRLVRAEQPGGQRRRYTEEQVDRALLRLDEAITSWGWTNQNFIRLFLVRQMIARRLGFSDLNNLFTGQFASSRAQEDYQSGEHFLLKPFIDVVWPLIAAHERGEGRNIIDILRENSPAFSINGPNAKRPLKEMLDLSKSLIEDLAAIWKAESIKNVLTYCRDNDLLAMSDRLKEQLIRQPRAEEYDEDLYSQDKGDWLADALLAMPTAELQTFCTFMQENTAFSTQHGVKGEEYPNVLVIFDDIEAAWNTYSFTKLLTPKTAGDPTEGQYERGRRLAYVCFSRAEQNLRILFFTPEPEAARKELLERGLFKAEQIVIAS